MKDKNSKLVYSTDPEITKQLEDDKKSVKQAEVINLPPEKQQIKISLQTMGRKGKQVTLIQGFQHDDDTLKKLARTLKKFCSAGGTVKNQYIEIQGDKQKMVTEKLRGLGYNIYWRQY